MIPDETNGDASRQEFIDLLSRMTKSDEPTTEITIVRDGPAVEDGEIINLASDDEDETGKNNDVEDGELSESSESDIDDVEVLNLRLNALRSLAGVKKRQKIKSSTRSARLGTQSSFSSRREVQTEALRQRRYGPPFVDQESFIIIVALPQFDQQPRRSAVPTRQGLPTDECLRHACLADHSRSEFIHKQQKTP